MQNYLIILKKLNFNPKHIFGDLKWLQSIIWASKYSICIMLTDKELVAAKERQEIELAAQRATLQEQRTHIDILDTALTNAQGNVVRLEEEVT